MRKNILTGIAFLTMLLALTACNQQTQPDLPNPTTMPTATFTPVPTAITLTVTPTSEPVHTPTSTPSPEPTNTTTPTPSPTPEPTSTPTPTPSPTLEPTSTPTPTPSPSPGPTSTPTPTPSPSPEPTNTPTPTPTKAPVVSSGLPEIIYKENTIIDDTMLTSEEEVNRYLFQMALDNYYLFGILAKDISMFHSEEEYLELFPEFIDIEFDTLTKYHNGYYLTVKNLKTTQTDLAYRYALRTGDTSFLTENETKAYHKLFDIANKLNLQELSDIEAVLAVHDYLVLNTDYDQLTAATGSGGVSHYAEGLLLHNLAVCSGYASTFQLLMQIAGIDCEYVFTDSHAWNLVQIDDEWYHIDVTWDDPVSEESDTILYTHFMMTDAEIAQLDDHKDWDCECEADHNCDDESYRLYPYKDYICTTEDEACALLLKQAEEDMISLIYPVSGPLTQSSLLDLAFRTLNLSGEITYYPEEPLGSSHYLLQIKN